MADKVISSRSDAYIGLRPGDLLPALLERTSQDTNSAISSRASTDLSRYYAILQRSLPQFSEGEALLIVDVCNGIAWMEPYSIGLLWANVADGVSLDQLDKKWQIDGTALVARLRELSYAETLAVVDAAERFWNAVARGDNSDNSGMVRRVGLVRD